MTGALRGLHDILAGGFNADNLSEIAGRIGALTAPTTTPAAVLLAEIIIRNLAARWEGQSVTIQQAAALEARFARPLAALLRAISDEDMTAAWRCADDLATAAITE